APPARPRVVAPVRDAPVPNHADADAQRHAPDEPAHTADRIAGERDRELLQHPRLLQAGIPRGGGELRLDREYRGPRKAKAAVELPEQIHERRAAMREEIMTRGLAL